MKEKIKTSSEDTKNKDPRVAKKRLAGVLAGLALGGIGGGIALHEVGQSAHPEKTEKQVELEAASEIAQRYICSVESITDLHQPPQSNGHDFSDSARRTTLEVKIKLEDNPAATPYVEKYRQDDSVKWEKPLVGAAIGIGANELPGLGDVGMSRPAIAADSDMEQKLRLEGIEDPRELNVHLYPRTLYKEGTEARIWVSQDVLTSDDKTFQTTTGYMDCGRMVFEGGVWKAEPLTERDQSVVKTEEKEWQHT